MNRFKFRAWCILEKKGSFIYFDLEDRCTFNFEIFDQEPIFQQYTELKDKNGKEIYEGDIVKNARTKVERTEFAKGCFTNHLIEIGEEIGEILFIKPSFCLSFNYIRYDYIMPMCLAEHRYEVIGNVFENPELLHIENK